MASGTSQIFNAVSLTDKSFVSLAAASQSLHSCPTL